MSKGLPIKFDLSGTVKSTIKVHASTGWIDESNTTMELTGNGEVKDNPKTPGGLTIPMVMTTETKVEGKYLSGQCIFTAYTAVSGRMASMAR